MRLVFLKVAALLFLTACVTARSPRGELRGCVSGEPCITVFRMEPENGIRLGDEVRFLVYAQNAQTIRFTLVWVPSIEAGRFIGEEVRLFVERRWPAGAFSVTQPVLFERSTMAFVDPLDPNTRLEALSHVRSGHYEMRVEIVGRRLDGKRATKRSRVVFNVSL
ncbi:MAG: hypothetical protein AAB967_00845 [Patescibacteria group bacterium]